MSKFKVGDVVSHPVGWKAEIIRKESFVFRLKLVEDFKYTPKGYTWLYYLDGYSYLVISEANTFSKQEKIIRKIQWLYKNSPSQFEKRWVKE